MSYCRFSSDNWKSDVYVYEDVSDLGKFWGSSIPLMRLWLLLYKLNLCTVRVSRRKKIGGPCDGDTYNDPDPQTCAQRLYALREMGYHVPQHALDELMEEANELQKR